MATGKRYYWIKLKESFMTSDAVDFMMSQPNGANYVVLYQMLCLKTVNTDGRLQRQIGEMIIPYDIEKIRRDCKWFSSDTIRIALDMYRRFGLVYEDQDGVLVLADHNNLVGSETDWAAKKKNQRIDQQALLSGDNVPSNVPANVPIDIRDKDVKSIDTRDIDSNDKGVRGTELCASTETVSAPPTNPPIISLPLIDGTDFGVAQDDIDKYSSLYPAVDVMQELRGMVGWLDANPKRRKTRGGVKRFINSWLSEEQNRGGTLRKQRQPQMPDRNIADTRPAPQGNPFAQYLEDDNG